jgi:hypothetical protein
LERGLRAAAMKPGSIKREIADEMFTIAPLPASRM